MLCAKYIASEEEIRAVPEPEFTKTWHPIGHGKLLDMVLGTLPKYGLEVRKRSFGLTNNGDRMFGVLDLMVDAYSSKLPFTMSVGLRNSIDQSLSAAVCCGSRVFVCDNLSFYSEEIISKKHVSTIEEEILPMIDTAIAAFLQSWKEREVAFFQKWMETQITVEKASDFLVEIAGDGFLPMEGIVPVRRYFKYPPFPEFEGNSVWTLFNAVTHYAKERRPTSPFIAVEESLNQVRRFRQEWPLITAA